MKLLQVFLPKDRHSAGVAHLFDDDGSVLLAGILCLGKADNQAAAAHGNPERDPARGWGDTPTGEYAPTRVEALHPPHPHMGAAWIPMEGIGGQALTAKLNGRTGLGVHAGRGDGRLVPTYGCLRVLDHSFAELVNAIDSDALRIRIEAAG